MNPMHTYVIQDGPYSRGVIISLTELLIIWPMASLSGDQMFCYRFSAKMHLRMLKTHLFSYAMKIIDI